MTGRRLPRSPRGRGLPRVSGTDAVSWPTALRGRSTLVCLVLLGWLGGGLLATAVAVVTAGPNDLAYGLTNTAAALIGLLLLAVAGPRGVTRRGRRRTTAQAVPVPEPAPAPVHLPAQTDHHHDDRREPALH